MTGYHDYLIVLSPLESVIDRVKALKEISYNTIGDYEGHYSKAYISIQFWPRKKPVWIEPMIPKVVRDLQNLSPVVLDINGFDCFENQYNPTIYARINSTPSTRIWFKYLRRYFSTKDFVPHITIARAIPNEAFNRLWPYFKNLKWDEQMKIDRLTILRREMIGHDKNYKIYKEIPFNRRFDFYDFANSKLKTPVISINKVNNQQVSLF